MAQKILFCKIAWMKYYRGVTDDDKTEGNLRYIRENGTGGEVENFLGKGENKEEVRGYFDPRTVGNTRLQVRIERIDSAYANRDKIENVLVIFCACKKGGSSYIVGWYKDATVYRELQKDSNGYEYNILAKRTNARLIDVKERTFGVPSMKQKDAKFGFGQALQWYADQESDSAYIRTVLDYVEQNDRTARIPD